MNEPMSIGYSVISPKTCCPNKALEQPIEDKVEAPAQMGYHPQEAIYTLSQRTFYGTIFQQEKYMGLQTKGEK